MRKFSSQSKANRWSLGQERMKLNISSVCKKEKKSFRPGTPTQGHCEKFYQDVQRPIPGPLIFYSPRQTGIICLYTNQYIDKTATMPSFRNRLTIKNYHAGNRLTQVIFCLIAEVRSFYLPGPQYLPSTGTISLLYHPVVCLRGGEWGTCLGHPLFGSTLDVLRVQIFLIFGEKPIIHSYNVLQSRS